MTAVLFFTKPKQKSTNLVNFQFFLKMRFDEQNWYVKFGYLAVLSEVL